MAILKVRNWEKFQHYRDRKPNWIKFYHREILHDYEILSLTDAQKGHLFMIWGLAAEMDNEIPADEAFIRQQIGAKNRIDLETLINKGFLELDNRDDTYIEEVMYQSAPNKEGEAYQIASIEKEREKEEEKEPPPIIPPHDDTEPEDSDPYLLAVHLRRCILETNPQAKVPDEDPGSLKRWITEADRMIRIDRRNPDDIAAVIAWAQQDSFWRSNILSMAKVRKHFDRLYDQAGLLEQRRIS